MEDLSLHILDIAENSVSAGAKLILISIEENNSSNVLLLNIKDNGSGIDKEVVKKVLDPFYTTRTTRRVGLGLSLLKQAAEDTDGNMELTSELGLGTELTARFTLNHIDMKPLGDITQTLITLFALYGDRDFLYKHKKNNKEFYIDTRELKEQLGEIPINDQSVLETIRCIILDEFESLH